MNATVAKPLGLRMIINDQFETAYGRVLTALKAAGFEIITEVNVRDLTGQRAQWHSQLNKLIVVCHPDLVQRALIVSPEAGVLLTCNVGVLEILDNQVEVVIADLLTAKGELYEPHLKSIADELLSRMRCVIDALKK